MDQVARHGSQGKMILCVYNHSLYQDIFQLCLAEDTIGIAYSTTKHGLSRVENISVLVLQYDLE